ncbi:hypothetical protein HMPREF1396_01434 [Helicobacter pylori GAM114Ai]|nr:hypothetical protein HMPREF1396_01434 [Helicobacter pylori GAM114Ai]
MEGFLFLNPLFLNSLFFGGFNEKSFLAFLVLVSGKLDTNLSDSFLKKRFFRGLVGLKGREWFQNTPYFLKGMRF